MNGSVTREEEKLAVAVSQVRVAQRQELISKVCETGTFESIAPYLNATTLHAAADVVSRSCDLGVNLLPLTSPRYPSLLRHIADPPSVLFIYGNGRYSIPSSAVAIVGRRAAQIEVCDHATRIAHNLAAAGITVVSGLALGIDAAAHRGALQVAGGCPTIAVLAHGLDMVYPPTHTSLTRQIVEARGVLVSEYAPGVKPRKHHFLARNRIIAGLSKGVVVIQAGARSGSLVTARCAADYGRDVFVVRGQGEEEFEAGGNNLLEQGAIPISGAHEVLHEYGLDSELGDTQTMWREATIENLLAEKGWSLERILREELRGTLERLPGNRVRIAHMGI